jgi:hypothetical protein
MVPFQVVGVYPKPGKVLGNLNGRGTNMDTNPEVGLVEVSAHDRALILAMYEASLRGEEERLAQMKHERTDLLGTRPDRLDRSARMAELASLDADINRLDQCEIRRLRGVVHDIRGGWDLLCIRCHNVSVLPRLERGHPTRHCPQCKQAIERVGASGVDVSDYGVYRPAVAW